MTITEIVEREVARQGTYECACEPNLKDSMSEVCTRAACLAVAKAVGKEILKHVRHDSDCTLASPGVDQECVEDCSHVEIRELLAAQGPGGKESVG